GTSHPDMSNATFSFEDGPVTLKKGSNSTTIANSSSIQETNQLDLESYGDLNADGISDVIWENSETRRFSTWLMNGTEVLVRGAEISGPAGS
ncbi:MAG: hypothetical protein ACMG6S_15110, partial [Byssovorax sp.]